jgi:hypothetical protein
METRTLENESQFYSSCFNLSVSPQHLILARPNIKSYQEKGKSLQSPFLINKERNRRKDLVKGGNKSVTGMLGLPASLGVETDTNANCFHIQS